MKTVEAHLYLDTDNNIVAVDDFGNRYRPDEQLSGLGLSIAKILTPPPISTFTPPTLTKDAIKPVETVETPKFFKLKNLFSKVKSGFVKADGSATELTKGLKQLLTSKKVKIPVVAPGVAPAPTQNTAASGSFNVGGLNVPIWAGVLTGIVVVGGIVFVATSSNSNDK